MMWNPVILNKVINNKFICLLSTFLKKKVLITSFGAKVLFSDFL